jgi:prepilin-type N-terminal cleavage/methylation domain-containing protein
MKKLGFTLIELLIVISLIITIGTMTAPFASGFLIRVYQESTVNSLVSGLHRAQSLSLDGRGSSAWGICHTGSIIRVYQGSCMSPTIKEDSSIPSTVTVSGLSDVTFSRINGEPSSALSITIASGAGTKNITLNELGVVDVN